MKLYLVAIISGILMTTSGVLLGIDNQSLRQQVQEQYEYGKYAYEVTQQQNTAIQRQNERILELQLELNVYQQLSGNKIEVEVTKLPEEVH